MWPPGSKKWRFDAERFMRTETRGSPSWPGLWTRDRIRCRRLTRPNRKNHLQTGRAIRFLDPLHAQMLVPAPQTGVFSAQIRTGMRDRHLCIGAPRQSRIPRLPVIPPGAQPRRGNPQLPGNLAQWPSAAHQQPLPPPGRTHP
jgi:hypothetical protein